MVQRQKRSQSRRLAILDAAMTCFSMHGFGQTGMNEIASESGASIGSIYHQFGSKDGIILALYLRLLEGYREGFIARVSRSDSAAEKIRSIVRFHIDWTLLNHGGAKFLHTMRHHPAVEVGEQEIGQGNRAFFKAVVGLIEPHILAGEIRELPHRLYTPLILGPTQEMVRHWLSGRGRDDLNEHREQLADAAWRSVKSEEENEHGGKGQH